MIIKRVAHLADIHISNDSRKKECQKIVIENTLTKLKELKINRIVISGDLFHDFLKSNNESKLLGGYFLNQCSKIAKVIITLGNHDYNAKSPKRKDTIQTVVDLMKNDNILYLNKTGFYEDENVIYAVFHHATKDSPYILYPDYNLDDENKTVINLFHDPINGSRTHTKQVFNDSHYINLSDFNDNISMLGDIHLQQIWNDDNGYPQVAYSSSLFQQNYGESPTNHGLLLWDISVKGKPVVESIDIDNEYIYYNIILDNKGGEIDYDNLDFSNQFIPKQFTHLKIHWNDLASNFNVTNRRKIKLYIKNNFPTVIELKFKDIKINGGVIKEDDYITNSIKKIHEPAVQREIFKNFLKEKGYDDQFIDEVLNIDSIITKRLNLTSDDRECYDWELLSWTIDNYRSHGDKTEINWENKDGIWQITGKNGQGKSNLLSSLQYLKYGKTLETKKKETFGDNRFINNKRDLNYCEVSGVYRINGIKYKIVKRTERKFDKTKTKLTGTPTTINYYQLDENNEVIENLNEEQRNLTQKIIENSIGTFDDFLRTALITGDTLNELLSMDEATFIDSILRDSGLDIFELKLNDYKEYKKQLYKKEEKIVIDPISSLDTIKQLEDNIKIKKIEIVQINKKILDTNDRLKKGTDLKEEEIKKLHKIDDQLTKLNIDTLRTTINNLIQEKDKKNNDIEILNQKIGSLKSNYDEVKYSTLLTEKNDIKEKIVGFKQQLNKYRDDLDLNDRKHSTFNGDILNINKQIDINKQNIINEQINIKTTISLKNNEKHNVIKNIDNQINNIKKEIEILEKAKICPSCDRELNKEAVDKIKNNILIKQQSINNLIDSKDTNVDVVRILNEISILEKELIDGNGKIDGFNKQIFNLTNDISLKEIEKQNIVNSNNIINSDVIKIKKDNDDINIKLTEVDEEISIIDIVIKEIKQRNDLITEKDNIPTQIEVIDLKIKIESDKFETYQLNEKMITENSIIQVKIDKFSVRLNELTKEKEVLQNLVNNINNVDIKGYENEIDLINFKLEKFKKQEREELVNKTYLECIHRDGLPKIILLKMRDDINIEISNLLTDVDFTVYFDEDMNLKMYNNCKPEAVINVISGCGMERTFISLVLRFALRSINNKSIGNVLFLDEITGKLLDESVDKFFDLIHKMKESIPKIVIIEHAHSDLLNADHIIDIIANSDGISTIEIKE